MEHASSCESLHSLWRVVSFRRCLRALLLHSSLACGNYICVSSRVDKCIAARAYIINHIGGRNCELISD